MLVATIGRTSPTMPGEDDPIRHAQALDEPLQLGPEGPVAEQDQPGARIAQPGHGGDGVRLALVPRELADEHEVGSVGRDRLARTVIAKGPIFVRCGRQGRPRVVVGVHADPGHPDQGAAWHEPVLAGSGLVLVVDDDEAVGPPPGDALREQERCVGQATATAMEMEPVRRVGDCRPTVLRHAPDGQARDERGDRGMDMDDIEGRSTKQPADRSLAADQPRNLPERTRQGDLPHRVESVQEDGIAGHAGGRGVHVPAQRPEMCRQRAEELPDRRRHGSHIQQAGAAIPGPGRHVRPVGSGTTGAGSARTDERARRSATLRRIPAGSHAIDQTSRERRDGA